MNKKKNKIKESIVRDVVGLLNKDAEIFEYWDGDTLHVVGPENIAVFANDMSEKEYDRMGRDLAKKQIKRPGYVVYAWNDVSDYKYWKREGENHEANYIQISIQLLDLNQIDLDELKHDAEYLFNYFYKYNNLDQHDFGAGKE